MADERSYKDADVRAIIDRALTAQPADGVSHDDLLAIGAEVGISPAAMEAAAGEVAEARLNQEATKAAISRRRWRLATHASVFVALNAFFFAINFLTTPGEWWVLFPVFIWGLGLLLHAGIALSTRVSPRRLSREKLRIQEKRKLRAVVRQRFAEVTRPSGVRVEGDAPEPEVAVENERSEARTTRGS